MAFKGWPVSAVEFYEGLEADNSKVYWTEHKAVYERDVKGPMEALLTELADEFGEGRIFRPYRDVRFSPDKSPYKTAMGATVGDGYVQVSADGLMAASGMYHMMPDQLDRYRKAVARRQDRCGPGTGDCFSPEGQGRRPGHRRPEDGSQGLPEGPPKGGAASQQGAHSR